ncbi:MAG: FAD-dependent oxidoreductase [Pseudomonadota bacterium]
MTRVAVIGAGISGLAAAHALDGIADVTVFEAADYIGGHTHTHQISLGGQNFAVDSGFIVSNPYNYPHFYELLGKLKVPLIETEMSFSVQNLTTGLEYNANRPATLFCQRRNLVRPSFWRMLADIRRFYQEAPALLSDGEDPGPSTGEYLRNGGYSRSFIDDHLIPMASALWSAPPERVMDFPMRYMVAFFQHHRMLHLRDRPTWRVVKGGSATYVAALLNAFSGTVHRSTPVTAVRRRPDGVTVTTTTGTWEGDYVVLACHSDQALALLEQPSALEAELLGALPYQANDVVLHTDVRILPRRRQAWAAWNCRVDPAAASHCTVTYNMNILQRLDAPETFCVTLNQTEQIDPDRVLANMTYHHPVYSVAGVAARARLPELNGTQRSYFCGAYHGWGFHEDGMSSGLRAAEDMKAQRLERQVA